jgi:MoaA/NifB/PqqE/SkfB family radical SAM enzyme
LQPLDESVESGVSKNKKINVLLNNLWPDPGQVNIFFRWLAKDLTGIKNSPRNIRAIHEYYLKPSSTWRFRCFAGQRNFVIYPNGDVSFCFKGSLLGNVWNDSINKILCSKKAKEERQSIAHCEKYCRIIGCNFSRGIREYLMVK